MSSAPEPDGPAPIISGALRPASQVVPPEYSEPKTSKAIPRHHKIATWRTTLKFSAVLTLLILIINIILIGWASGMADASKFVKPGDNFVTIFSGQCEQMRKTAVSMHFVISVLGTLLLVASTTAMACIMAPTREEVDRAHKKGLWVDVGVVGMRNFRFLGWRQRGLLVVLVLVTVPLLMQYNSIIMPVQNANSYYAVGVFEDFFTTPGPFMQQIRDRTASYDWTTNAMTDDGWHQSAVLTVLNLKARQSSLTNLTRQECIQAFRADFQSEYQNVLLVTAAPSTNGSVQIVFEPRPDPWLTHGDQRSWMCLEQFKPLRRWTNNSWSKCDFERLKSNETWDVLGAIGHRAEDPTWIDVSVDYCLAEPAEETACELRLKTSFLAGVIVGNAVILICICAAIFMGQYEPLITVGDAVASFLRVPEAKAPVLNQQFGQNSGWRSTYRGWWFQSASLGRWIVFGVFFLPIWFVALGLGIQRSLESTDIKTSFNIGLEGIDAGVFLESYASHRYFQNINTAAMVVSTLQIWIAIFFLLYDRLLTSMLGASELHSYLRPVLPGQTLRVTNPTSTLHSTYWLHLPYLYSFPLIVGTAVLSWMASQAFYAVEIAVIPTRYGIRDITYQAGFTAWSWFALVLAIVFSAIMVAVLCAIGFRKFDRAGPFVSSSSIDISTGFGEDPEGANEERNRMLLGDALAPNAVQA